MKKRILIIDDEDKIRDIYKRYFRAIGSSIFEIFESSNAEDVTECLIREDVDIVILDIKMPEIDGKYMYGVIKEHNPKLNVIVASVYPIDKQKRLIPFAKDYYDKSHGPMQLLVKVSQTLLTQAQN